jgi:hypothetical protein
MKQREHIRSIWSNREDISKLRIMGKVRNKRARALTPIGIAHDIISNSFNRASETQIALIKTWKILSTQAIPHPKS